MIRPGNSTHKTTPVQFIRIGLGTPYLAAKCGENRGPQSNFNKLVWGSKTVPETDTGGCVEKTKAKRE